MPERLRLTVYSQSLMQTNALVINDHVSLSIVVLYSGAVAGRPPVKSITVGVGTPSSQWKETAGRSYPTHLQSTERS